MLRILLLFLIISSHIFPLSHILLKILFYFQCFFIIPLFYTTYPWLLGNILCIIYQEILCTKLTLLNAILLNLQRIHPLNLLTLSTLKPIDICEVVVVHVGQARILGIGLAGLSQIKSQLVVNLGLP